MRLAFLRTFRSIGRISREFKTDTPVNLEKSNEKHKFFTLRPEIRHQVYRPLFAPKDEKSWIRTTILEYSRRFNEDGTPILYREKTFKLGWFIDTNSLLKV